ncbi:hypothetical protein [Microbulbifer hydrolyticus]|uniref:DUF2860 domain-containing protein n=1 Tax=Microbulbifer hydrolyticus TaxID=48074 RepID=A0A6P1T566_9GAMM|nr:hypothetical protein [Microbulbifer hydrolyticus]MBB5211205.1 hypothetical protein [Microbulbifer hydrolyticus]QHQ38024.1 hypothetical protein GTQ55_02745 [Microbulbifer hydrolyticus]
MKAKRIPTSLCIIALLCSAEASAESSLKNSIKLAAITSSETGRTGLGVQFDFKDIALGFVNFNARGTYAFDDEIRSQDLMHFGLDAELVTIGDCYEVPADTGHGPIAIPPGQIPGTPDDTGPRSQCPLGSWKIKSELSYETDQDFTNKNTVAGLTAAWAMPEARESHVFRQFYSLLDLVPSLIRSATGRPDANRLLLESPVVSLTIGQVDPQEDEVREQLLGKLDHYYRSAAEVSLTTPIAKFDGRDVILAYDYRYFRELDAEQAVKDAKLHRSRLIQLSLRMPSDNERGYAFIGYSSGRLPFGIDDEVLKVGWNYQL